MSNVEEIKIDNGERIVFTPKEKTTAATRKLEPFEKYIRIKYRRGDKQYRTIQKVSRLTKDGFYLVAKGNCYMHIHKSEVKHTAANPVSLADLIVVRVHTKEAIDCGFMIFTTEDIMINRYTINDIAFDELYKYIIDNLPSKYILENIHLSCWGTGGLDFVGTVDKKDIKKINKIRKEKEENTNVKNN